MKKMKNLFETPKKTAITLTCIIAAAALLGTISIYAAGAIAKNSSIGAENAQNFAFVDAGIDPASARTEHVEFDFEEGQFVYEVEFVAEGWEYEYWIKASDGTVVKKKREAIDSKKESTVTPQQESAIAPQRESTVTPQQQSTVTPQQESTVTPQQESSSQLSLDEAKNIALADAAVPAADVTYKKAKLDHDDGRAIYEIEFYTASHEYDYEIDVQSKAILSKKTEALHQDGEKGDGRGSSGNAGTSVGMDQAKSIALSHAQLSLSDVTFSKAELDREDGQDVYEIEFYHGNMEYEYTINASTGAIVESDCEPAD